MYKVLYTRDAAKVLTRLPGNLAARIRSKIEQLAQNPFAPNNNIKALVGSERYRLRIGDWRVIYQINRDKLELIVFKNCPTRRGIPMKPQIIEKNGKPEYAVLAYDDYVRLVEAAQDAADAKEIFDISDLVPSEVVDRLLAGENAVRVWREHRGMTQQELADAAGISKPYISQIETGERTGHASLSKIAEALNLSVDEIIPRDK